MKRLPNIPSLTNLKLTDRIAETLLITLSAKAVESKQANPIIRDEVACELVKKIDYDFSKFKKSRANSVGVALRAVYFDNKIKKFIAHSENPVVVLVGCGLDARIQRLGKIAGKAMFYALDIEEVIELRKQLLPAEENEYYIAGSMLSTEWMEGLKAKHPGGDFIFIIEGVLMYFSEADNRFVFSELAKRFNGAELHFDMLNKWMSRNSKRHRAVKETGATFKFGVDDVREMERWDSRLKFCKAAVMTDFKAVRKMGLPIVWMMKIFPFMRNNIRLVSYKILPS